MIALNKLGVSCAFCGQTPDHGVTACPHVTAIDYDERGHIRRVEFGLRFPPPDVHHHHYGDDLSGEM